MQARAQGRHAAILHRVQPGPWAKAGAGNAGIARKDGRQTATPARTLTSLVAARQAFSANFWKVWQPAGTCPRLAAKVHVTSLT